MTGSCGVFELLSLHEMKDKRGNRCHTRLELHALSEQCKTFCDWLQSFERCCLVTKERRQGKLFMPHCATNVDLVELRQLCFVVRWRSLD
jgi:hypothetical protein